LKREAEGKKLFEKYPANRENAFMLIVFESKLRI